MITVHPLVVIVGCVKEFVIGKTAPAVNRVCSLSMWVLLPPHSLLCVWSVKKRRVSTTLYVLKDVLYALDVKTSVSDPRIQYLSATVVLAGSKRVLAVTSSRWSIPASTRILFTVALVNKLVLKLPLSLT